MTRTFVNLLIDLGAGLLFLAMVATGYLIRFPLPPGTNKEFSLWGLTRHQWGGIHFWISLALVGLLVIHLVLHWEWLVSVIRKRLHLEKASPRKLLRLGLSTSSIILGGFGLFAWAAHSGVQEITDTAGTGVCSPQADSSQPPTKSGDTPPATTALATVDFWQEVYPIFAQHCLSCHGPRKQRGDFRIDRKEDLFSSAGQKPWVIPGKSAESPLVGLLSGQRPDIPFPNLHQLPAAELAKVRAWIDAGAVWPERPAGKF